MDLVPLFDRFGEAGTALLGGAVLGALFGFFAQRSAFCTRSAVLDLTRKRDYHAFSIWLAGFAVAVLGVQLLIWNGTVSVLETRFFSTAQSLSGAVVGGLLFGVGMVLARGCVSRLMVLGASGNLRAIASLMVVAIAGYATYAGLLAPLRDGIGSVATTQATGGNDILAQMGLPGIAGVVLGSLLLAASFVIAARSALPVRKYAFGALVGATIVGGWYFTHEMSLQVFEPVQAESLSFIRPLATTIALATDPEGVAGFDQGILIGIFAGAFLAALLFGNLRLARFGEAGTPSVPRYLAGSVLMGFGGILAVGCTIGAGFTGGSVLALSSVAGLAAMVVGAALADRLIDVPQGDEALSEVLAAPGEQAQLAVIRTPSSAD